MAFVASIYFLVNIAYLVVVTKEDIRNGERLVAAYFFRNLFGATTERISSVVVSFSTLGNMLAVSFTQSRVIQELGREGALPYSAAFASNAPFDTPCAALALQWITCTVWMFSPPPGDAFNFVLNLHSYPYALINICVSAGLLWLYYPHHGQNDWNPPYRASAVVVTMFLISNIFLAVVPMIPPKPGFSSYEHLPHWLHIVATFGILLVGVSYWFIWTKFLPRHSGYTLLRNSPTY